LVTLKELVEVKIAMELKLTFETMIALSMA
jgi:hypothetical protein